MAEPAASRPVRLAQIAVALLLAARLVVTLGAPPIGDEAYYWIWGQHPALSYFDHPPLHAWLLGLMSVFGWNLVALRLLTWLTLGGTLAIFWLWAKRLKPEDPAAWFWPSAALYLASPLFFLMSAIAFHDHLLIFLCLASAHCFLVFAERWEADGTGYRWLYAGGALLGLAVLTKYNGVLFGVGVALFFLLRKPLRPLWRSPHLYLAALLGVALQAPVLWWNFNEGFASYNFHLSERWGGAGLQFQPLNLVLFAAAAVAVISPVLLPAIAGIVRRPLGQPFADRARMLALAVFAVSSAAMVVLSLFVEVFFYWNIVAFLLLMPLAAGWLGRRLAVLHFAYGAIFALGCVVNFLVAPIGNLADGDDWTFASTFGWPEVAVRVETLRHERDIGFVATTRYTTAAQLGFALHDADVTALAARHDQYDFWFDAAAHRGEDALVVTDPRLGTGYAARLFDSLELVETVAHTRFGLEIYEARIYLGRGFRPPPAP